MLAAELRRCVPQRAQAVFERAVANSQRLVDEGKSAIEKYAAALQLDVSDISFVVVGSVGRMEGLEASDFDFIPVASSEAALAAYAPHDTPIREALATRLGVKVSKGHDLTKAVSITELVEPDCIGGSKDTSGSLTKRILILTESRQVAGGFSLGDIRRALLNAYAKEERTSGRHVLSLCNDIARYYKTLCIEYKAKIDDEEKDWCSRNIKLRHSRKFWYFANIVAVVQLAENHPLGDDEFAQALLGVFDDAPAERLANALCASQPIIAGRLLENFAMFLDFMSKSENRDALTAVDHDNRYDMKLGNPFLPMKFNSDVLHRNMTAILDGLPTTTRDRVVDWFLL